MTDEKMNGNPGRVSVAENAGVLTERQVRPISAIRPSAKKPSLRGAASSLLGIVLGFLLGGTEFPLQTYPLGCALVSALPRHMISAMIGIVARSVYLLMNGEELLVPMICSVSLLTCRIVLNFVLFGKSKLLRLKRLPDPVSMKMLLCAIFVFGISFLDAVYVGITPHSVLRAALSAIVAVTFTLLFTFFFDEEYRQNSVFEAGFGAICFSLALSFAPFSIGTFAVGQAAAFAITLYTGFLGAPTRSASVGLLCGATLGGFFGPVFALAGLVAGIFSDAYVILGGFGALLVTACGLLYFSGLEMVTEVFPELLTATGLLTFLVAFRCLPRSRFPETSGIQENENAACALWTRKNKAEREQRMMGLSKAMDSLSCMVQGLSERFRRPSMEKMSEKCKEIWKSHCHGCPNESTCKGISESEADKISAKLASNLYMGGKLNQDHLWEITRIRCPYLEPLAQELNDLSAKMLEDAIRDDKTKVFALDYGIMSKMFADVASCEGETVPADKMLSERLRRAFHRAGLRAEHVLVCGDRKKTVIVTGEEVANTTLRSPDIRSICENICLVKFGNPSFVLEDGSSAFVLESLPGYTVEAVMKQVPKKGETVCGDSIATAVSKDGYFYCFLCDGMGSGEEASLTAKLCRIFLEKMLICGNKKSTTLSMLNNLLCSRNTECFATVDLCEIDLVRGEASFLKSGAVPSFVMRDGHLYKISSGTFPIGILPQVSAENTDFALCAGDVIVLCSDGILPDGEACDGEETVRFLDMIAREWTEDLESMADKILTYSSDFSVRTDDMTIAFLRVKQLK
ncbi:MAG: SpoIIE family protein phosphatase [Clostridia bacterium]|nr:SpoIIE family protein phosphatase [Clostridia bacterium]